MLRYPPARKLPDSPLPCIVALSSQRHRCVEVNRFDEKRRDGIGNFKSVDITWAEGRDGGEKRGVAG